MRVTEAVIDKLSISAVTGSVARGVTFKANERRLILARTAPSGDAVGRTTARGASLKSIPNLEFFIGQGILTHHHNEESITVIGGL